METIIALRESIKKQIDNADTNTLEKIEELLQFGEYDPLFNMSKEQEASLLRGIKDADTGKVSSHENVFKKFEQWRMK